MAKQTKILISLAAVLILAASGYFAYQAYRGSQSGQPMEENLLGGDRDEHGCIGSAGYSWCEAKGKCLREWEEKCAEAGTAGALSEAEARLIAEETCVKGGESLAPGYYNGSTRTWWFDANLNAVQEGCNPACVVSEETRAAEINWRCTGALVPEEEAQESEARNEAILRLFMEKYPKYADTMSVSIIQETGNHARGSISFEEGAPGGNFLAAKIGGEWQIAFDGNGAVDCEKLKADHGFPDEILKPVFCD